MKVQGKHYRTIFLENGELYVIDQQKLPHKFEICKLSSTVEVCRAIKDMTVRGAGLIGATAGYGMYLAAKESSDSSFDSDMEKYASMIISTRPTAKNLEWAVRRQQKAMSLGKTKDEKIELAMIEAEKIADEDSEFCRMIGLHGKKIIQEIALKKKGRVNVLTHCNAGWLAFVDHGSALSPVYSAFDSGIDIHVWVDETRPRNQGASLTAWELTMHGVPHHIIADNTGGHLMQHGMVDIAIVGSDRVTYTGDVANKIGTYLKALAAKDNGVPFYAAFPSSTFDWDISDGVKEIPIEERSGDEVRYISGLSGDGSIREVLLCPKESNAMNYGFDVTPARLLTGLITERGVCDATKEGIYSLFPEKKK